MKKIVSAFLICIMIFVTGCSGNTTTTETDDVNIRVGSLKGPTSIGLVSLMNEAKAGNTVNQYADFTVVAAADELNTMFIKGELDIILVPANVASVLYNKTEGAVKVIDINTLGVLYMVSADTSIKEISELSGKTIYLTGKGTTPDYVLQYLLRENGLEMDEVTLEYKSEATEVAAILKENPNAVALLPEPFVTTVCAQNSELSVIFDTTKEWEKIQGEDGGKLVTGVTIVRETFWEEHASAVMQFVSEHKESAEFTVTDLEKTAEYVAESGIIPKAEVAKKAIPKCNIVCITGEDMKTALSSYLEVLFEQEPSSIGGVLPNDDFYCVW